MVIRAWTKVDVEKLQTADPGADDEPVSDFAVRHDEETIVAFAHHFLAYNYCPMFQGIL